MGAPGEDHTSFAVQQFDCSRPLRAGSYCIGFNIPQKEAKACIKVQLVKALALKVADEDFAEIVCQSLSQPKKSKDDGDTAEPECDELGKMRLEMLEPSELSEFLDLKKEVQRKEKSQKMRQWKKWQQEAEDEFRLNLV